jgi:ankyrin repeat protein
MTVSKNRKPKTKSRKTPAATKRAIHIRANVNLFDAIKKDDIAAVRILLDAGADVNAKDNVGLTTLHWAAMSGHVECGKMLLDVGADIAVWGPIRNTALHFAAMVGHADIVRMLLDAGADVHAKDKYGNTALMEAEETGHDNIVALLNEHIMHAELPEARGPSGGKVDSPGI